MAGGSKKNSRCLAYSSKSSVRVKRGNAFKKQIVKGQANYQKKSQISYRNKQSGCYGKVTTSVNKSVSGEYVCRKNGTSGVKKERKKSMTVRVGDRKGYTEIYHEERFRRVTFDKCSNNKSNNNIVPVAYEKYRQQYDCNDSESESESESEYEYEYESESEYEYESESQGYYLCSDCYSSDSD